MGLDQSFVLTKRADDYPDDDTLVHIGEDWMGRKENHIHAWVAKVNGEEPGNCVYTEVSIEDMNGLVLSIEMVLKDRNLAEELLPTQSGFFFGGTDYDQYYFDDLEQELKIFTAMLKKADPETDVFLYHCWW